MQEVRQVRPVQQGSVGLLDQLAPLDQLDQPVQLAPLDQLDQPVQLAPLVRPGPQVLLGLQALRVQQGLPDRLEPVLPVLPGIRVRLDPQVLPVLQG